MSVSANYINLFYLFIYFLTANAQNGRRLRIARITPVTCRCPPDEIRVIRRSRGSFRGLAYADRLAYDLFRFLDAKTSFSRIQISRVTKETRQNMLALRKRNQIEHCRFLHRRLVVNVLCCHCSIRAERRPQKEFQPVCDVDIRSIVHRYQPQGFRLTY